jgi:hypothetical protein
MAKLEGCDRRLVDQSYGSREHHKCRSRYRRRHSRGSLVAVPAPRRSLICATGAQFLLPQGQLSSYLRSMTKLLEQAIEGVRRLPLDSQDEIARAILHLAESEAEAEPVDPAHLTALLEGLAQAKRREFATDDEVEAGALIGEAAGHVACDARSCRNRRVSAYL